MTGTRTNAPRRTITALGAELGTEVNIGSATVEFNDLYTILYTVSEPYRNRGGAWFMNDSTDKTLAKTKNADDLFVWQPSAAAARPDTLLGFPVYIAPAMDSIGSAQVSVAFGDPSTFQIRQTPIRTERSADFGFDGDVLALRSVIRVDNDRWIARPQPEHSPTPIETIVIAVLLRKCPLEVSASSTVP